ncbi:hypothetical protein QMO56_15560 [Roseomonas sp. E05]|uniref:hypothetical protein n=1 Tax=Roseomonas sp. E05 TaxID=3046310 RepID=UPI0024B94DEA|nr:hypothetical protein [Roseomonas sp. E05]MDJ0389534.1 hypothetical protein [Roseomonas sp. E05]
MARPFPWRLRFAVPASHPCLPGHFPGRPVVPGVVLLDALFTALAEEGHGLVTRLLRAKFTAPVAPEEEVEVEFRSAGPGRVTFQCHCRGALALSGEAALEPAVAA